MASSGCMLPSTSTVNAWPWVSVLAMLGFNGL
jgi:hypothetical protein